MSVEDKEEAIYRSLADRVHAAARNQPNPCAAAAGLVFFLSIDDAIVATRQLEEFLAAREVRPDAHQASGGWLLFAFGIVVTIAVLCGGAYLATGPWPIPLLALLTLPIAGITALWAWQDRQRR